MKRLYIGGLTHTITQKDLKDRFGKFGNVHDVELRTRRDDEGVPYKTFGYINLEITDADFKKCMTVLNKSKWKGGTIQIEQAKESFLQKLSQERQEALENAQLPSFNNKDKLMDTMKMAGVENFHMKAAVPGTEVPGHKDWVVSKFGRVLPVLNLKCQGRNKISLSNYDPSKHSHNIKKLETTEEGPDLMPVSKLTWEISGGDDEISKKRRGEFPPQKPAKKRKGSSAIAVIHQTSETGSEKCNGPSAKVPTKFQKSKGEAKAPIKANGANLKRQNQNSVCLVDSSDDSDISQSTPLPETRVDTSEIDDNSDYLEVVGKDYVPKTFLVTQQAAKNVCHLPHSLSKRDDDYDSADTDEILSSRKTVSTLKQDKLPECHTQNNHIQKNDAVKAKADRVKKSSDDNSKSIVGSKSSVKKAPLPSECESESDDSEASADSEYEAMFSNCQRLEFSLDDLQQLVKESFLKGLDQDSDNEDDGSDSQLPGPSQVSKESSVEPQITSSKDPEALVKTGMGITPEEILAAIMDEDSSDEERKTKKKKGKKKAMNTSTLPAFQGTKALVATSTLSQNAGQDVLKRQIEEEDEMNTSTKKQKCDTRVMSKSSPSVVVPGHGIAKDVAKTVPKPSGSETTQSPALKNPSKVNKLVDPKSSEPVAGSTSCSSGSSSEDSDSSEEEKEEEEDGGVTAVSKAFYRGPAQENTDVPKMPGSAAGTVDAKQQLLDNQRRLSALEQRQKEAELQKKLIQDALTKVDALTAGKGNKHIKFSSDEEVSDDDDDEPSSPVPLTPKKILFQSDEEESVPETKSEKLAGSKLFDSDNEEDDDKEEGGRFHIKPQFEGKAGAKLMQLQTRFGTDERFQLDSRFIDNDDDDDEDDHPEEEGTPLEQECELSDEKKKNLDILSDLLNINIQPSDPNKPTAKVKTFRDISALQYDPTKQEHASFETKNDQLKKESKLTRKKKREEAEKLPEVSKDIYYDVAVDLKEVFGTTREDKTEEVKNVAWDEEEEQKEEELSTAMEVDPVQVSNEGEVLSNFKFSFFGDDTQAETTTEKEKYHVQMLKGPKLSWQADPRFQDSSDDEEEEKEEEMEKSEQPNCIATLSEESVASKKSFFFHLEDVRLKEGPKAFCRTAKLEDQRDVWNEKRTGLIEEYRKKHKDARRKLKTSKKY
ncbi:hypothetical protein DPEC_G00249300 [Dallia pectoralis]|uniref:Uncharacterized protein n=1 Tax=Dallia pectoralis TaxID=75939 RepID=A0ACC2FSX9_DALPE|nr:hypothetical protein DPEC_G00249300 [Dallia pectoralis]